MQKEEDYDYSEGSEEQEEDEFLQDLLTKRNIMESSHTNIISQNIDYSEYQRKILDVRGI
jgi:hypothetical protein